MRIVLLLVLSLLPAFLSASLVAPDGLGQPAAPYTVVEYKSKLPDVQMAKRFDQPLVNYLKINYHGDSTVAQKIVYTGRNATDSVVYCYADIPAGWNGKSKHARLNIMLSSTASGVTDTLGVREFELMMVSSTFPLVEHDRLVVRINPPKPAASAQRIGFVRTSGTVTLPGKNDPIPELYEAQLRLYGVFTKNPSIYINHNDYPGLIFPADTKFTFTDAERLRGLKAIPFELSDKGFINDNIQFFLEKTSNATYELQPGAAVLDAEVIDPQIQDRVTASFLTNKPTAPVYAGDAIPLLVTVDGFDPVSETDVDVTFAIKGDLKYPGEVEVTAAPRVTRKKEKNNQFTLNVKGGAVVNFSVRPLVNPKKVGKTGNMTVEIVEIRPSSKDDFKKALGNDFALRRTYKVEQPVARTAVAYAPLTDTECTVTVPDGPLVSPYVDSPVGIVSNFTATTFDYNYTDLLTDSALANGFIDEFRYTITHNGLPNLGRTRVYSGKQVVAGSNVRLSLRQGTFIKAPTVVARYYDPVKDPFETAKKPKKTKLKLITKLNKDKSDTDLAYAFTSVPAIYDKAALKKAWKEGTFSADAAATVQKTYAGMELVLSWSQEKEGNNNYVGSWKDSSFGAVLVCSPLIAVDSPVVPIGGTVVDTALTAENEYMMFGRHFGSKPKLFLEYRDANSGKVKRLTLKVVKTPKKADPVQYTEMNPVTGASHLRFVMPAAPKLFALTGNLYLVVESGSGFAATPVTLK